MKKTYIIICLLIVVIFIFSCGKKSEYDVFQSKRDNVEQVKNNIKSIKTINEGNVLFSKYSYVHICDNYLVFYDGEAPDYAIHIFDKNSFEYLKSTGSVGPGPGEITHIVNLSYNKDTKSIYALDGGKLIIYSFNIDSVLQIDSYLPYEKYVSKGGIFPFKYVCVNDSTIFSTTISIENNQIADEQMSIWNLLTGKYKILKYNHPCEVKYGAREFEIAVSEKDSVYANCCWRYDLISLFDFNGNLIKNIYGPDWNPADSKINDYYNGCIFTDKYLITTYNGNKSDESYANECIVFTKDGDYVKTLDIGYNIVSFDYDNENNRIVFMFDDNIQCGYLELEQIL